MSRIMLFERVILLVCVAGLIACSEDGAKNLSYQETAQRNYYLGIQALKKENYVEAQKYFQFIKSKYDRFVKYYILADLRIGDCYFYDEKYNQAIQQFRMFI